MPEVERTAMRKVLLRVVAFMGLLYVTNLLDRFNVGYAALTMNHDLGLSPSQFGFGAGIFFAGYLLAELPSNLLMMRFGARVWIARIMLSWGVVSAGSALVGGATSFYVVRILLGITEAGFLPGAMLYLATWVPAQHRSKCVLLFFAIGQFAALGGPIVSGWILSVPTLFGLRSWQALFVLEALPAILLGLVVLFTLPNRPEEARFLSAPERDWLVRELERDSAMRRSHGLHGLREALLDQNVWALFVSKFANGLAVFTVALWLPQIARHNTGLAPGQLGWIVAVPSIVTIPTMWLVGNYSDRTGRRRVHTASALALCATCSLGAALDLQPILSLVLIGLASVCAVVATGISWAIAPAFLDGPAAAGGFAIVNAGGISAGFVGGYLIGWLREATGNFNFGLYAVAVTCGAGALAVLTLRPMVLGEAGTRSATLR